MLLSKKVNNIAFCMDSEQTSVSSNGYGFLWYFLKLTGIDVFGSHEGEKTKNQHDLTQKCCEKIFPFLLHLNQIYVLVTSLFLVIQEKAYAEIVASFTVVNLFSFVVWHIVYRSKNNVKSLIFEANRSLLILHKERKSYSMFINLCLILSMLIPIASATTSAFFMDNAPGAHRRYYSLFVNFSGLNAFLIRCIFAQLTYTFMLSFPCCISVMCASLYYQCSCVFVSFNAFLMDTHKGIAPLHKILKLMDVYQLLHDLAQKTEEILSPITFVLLCSQLLSMYTALANFVIFKNQDQFYAIVWHCLAAITIVPAVLIGIILCAGRISCQARLIHTNLQQIHNTLIRKSEDNWESVLLVRSMMMTEFPVMTAANIMDLKHGVILSVFGTLFTYGLLIININRP
ncbi:uncharacterized protein NPIL_244131 [Nephila pilipes]|uniref:Gustatory receptor n=1 Tax=Nephila pilipes TaxID=299642 RepID=A0A8X6QK10_NEPPI|nr:uncharacterized protein NPIL_244131 [Nephila pilipes]